MTPELPEALQVAFRVIAVLEELGAPYHVIHRQLLDKLLAEL